MAHVTDSHWQKWGRTNPYYAVLSDDKFRKENLANNTKEFFDSGFSQADRVVALLTRHFGPMSLESALDFGCGVGRVMVGLGRHFRQVTGIDISPDMLAEARRNLDHFKISNATLLESDDRLSNVAERFDLVHTYIVLQHIPVARGRIIINSLLSHLKPRGAIALHVTLRRNLSPLRRLTYQARRSLPALHYAVNAVRGRPITEPFVQMNEYDLVELIELLSARGMGEAIVVPEQHGTYSTATLYARKIA